MDSLSIDYLICYATTLGAVVLTVLAWKVHWKQLKTHYFFLFFFSLSTVYLQAAPLASLLNDTIEASFYVHEYAVLQLLSLVLFQVPMLLVATWEPARPDPSQAALHDGVASRILAGGWGAEAVCCACGAYAVLYFNTVVQNDLFFNRVGSDIAANRMVSLSFVDHAMYRSFQEMFLFMAGTLYFIFRSAANPRTRALALCVLVICLGSWGTTALLNSRWSVAIACVCLVGWWLSLRPGGVSQSRTWIIFGAIGLLAAYLMNVVLNVRKMGGFQGDLRLEFFTPGLSLFDGDQGFNRLNGIDLMARLMVPISEEGPALGTAWTHILWDVRRLVDPAGFNEFRLSLETNAKSYLMTHYLGWRVVDYYSCMMTDLFGNFGLFGFPLGALIMGLIFRALRRMNDAPRSGTSFLVALFVLTHVIQFEQEASVLLFGWVKKLPIFLMILAARPITIIRVHSRGPRPVEGPPGGRNGHVARAEPGLRPGG